MPGWQRLSAMRSEQSTEKDNSVHSLQYVMQYDWRFQGVSVAGQLLTLPAVGTACLRDVPVKA